MGLATSQQIVDEIKYKITFDSMQCKYIDLEADEKLGVYHWRGQRSKLDVWVKHRCSQAKERHN